MGRTPDESKNDRKQRRQECSRMTREDTKFGNASYEELRKANYFAKEQKKKAEILERVRLMNEKTFILLEKKRTGMETFMSECQICTKRKKPVVLRPCNHAQLCEDCAMHCAYDIKPSVCPFCRVPLDAEEPFIIPFY